MHFPTCDQTPPTVRQVVAQSLTADSHLERLWDSGLRLAGHPQRKQ